MPILHDLFLALVLEFHATMLVTRSTDGLLMQPASSTTTDKFLTTLTLFSYSSLLRRRDSFVTDAKSDASIVDGLCPTVTLYIEQWFFITLKNVRNLTQIWFQYLLDEGIPKFVRWSEKSKPNFLSKNSLEFGFKKCELCEKWDFENVNFVKIGILKMWIWWKLRFL